MTESNKQSLIQFGKVILLFVLGIIAIITASGVWNGVYAGAIDSFYGWVAGLNFVAEGFGVWSLWRYFFKKKEEAKVVEEVKPVEKKTTRVKKNTVTVE